MEFVNGVGRIWDKATGSVLQTFGLLDFFQASVDPTDQRIVWAVGEYAKNIVVQPPFNWGTHLQKMQITP